MGAVSIWELAANSGSSWMSQATDLHLHVAMQLLRYFDRMLKERVGLCACSGTCRWRIERSSSEMHAQTLTMVPVSHSPVSE